MRIEDRFIDEDKWCAVALQVDADEKYWLGLGLIVIVTTFDGPPKEHGGRERVPNHYIRKRRK